MCEIGSGDYDQAAVWSKLRPTARKEHRCYACRARILPGEKYTRLSAVFDGSASTEKACAACNDACERFGREHHFEPFPTALEEHLVECLRGVTKEHQREEDKQWRRDLAGIKWRGRRARRESRLLGAPVALSQTQEGDSHG